MSTTTNLVRTDRDTLHPTNLSSLKKEYGEYYETVSDLALFLSDVIKKGQKNLWGYYELSVKDFSKFSKRSASNLNRIVRDEQGNEIVAGVIADENGKEYKLYTYLEHSLMKMMDRVQFTHVSKFRRGNDAGTSLEISSFSFLKRVKVFIPNKKSKERIYEIFPDEEFIQALVKNFVTLNSKDLNALKSSRNSKYPLYFYMCELKANALHKFQQGEKDKAVSTPYYEILKRVCDINSEDNKYIKKNITNQLNNIIKKTTLKFKFEWVRTGDMRFPFQLLLFWEYDKDSSNVDKKELYRVYNNAYYEYLLHQDFVKSASLSNDTSIEAFAEWLADPVSLPQRVKRFIESYNYIYSKDINVADPIVLAYFNVADAYKENLYEQLRKTNSQAGKKELNAFVNSQDKKVKEVKLSALQKAFKDNLAYRLTSKSNYISVIMKTLDDLIKK